MKSYIDVFFIGLRFLKKEIFDDDHIGQGGLIAFLGLILPYQLIKLNNLNNYQAWTVGIINKSEWGHNSGKYYKFEVDGKIYHGRAGYGGLSKIEAGDSIYVVYDYTDPNNNALDGYFEYRLDRSRLPDTVYHRQEIDKMRRPINH